MIRLNQSCIITSVCRIIFIQSASPRQAISILKHFKKLKIKYNYMKVKNKIDQHCKQLRLSALGSQVQPLADAAAAEGISYLELAARLLETEIAHRNQKDMLRKIRFAKLPAMHELQAYDCAQVEGMPPAKLQQLKELTWLDQNFNLVIMGPNGVGKSLLAAGVMPPCS